jgi:hypothetical protein
MLHLAASAAHLASRYPTDSAGEPDEVAVAIVPPPWFHGVAQQLLDKLTWQNKEPISLVA